MKAKTVRMQRNALNKNGFDAMTLFRKPDESAV
jgi:hypothetical protein